jgi:hypothetical protein
MFLLRPEGAASADQKVLQLAVPLPVNEQASTPFWLARPQRLISGTHRFSLSDDNVQQLSDEAAGAEVIVELRYLDTVRYSC